MLADAGESVEVASNEEAAIVRHIEEFVRVAGYRVREVEACCATPDGGVLGRVGQSAGEEAEGYINDCLGLDGNMHRIQDTPHYRPFLISKQSVNAQFGPGRST